MRFLILILALAMISGCSGLQATPEMATAIQVGAVKAQPILAPALAPADARAYLKGDGGFLQTAYQASTINVFAYWFDPAKTIFVTPDLYSKNRAVALDYASYSKRADALADADAKAFGAINAQAIINIDKQRQGAK